MPVTFQEKYNHRQALSKQAVRASVYVFPELLSKKTTAFHRYFKRRSGGFTLLELLVVIALMALVTSAAVLALENTSDDAAIPIARSEMVEISKALRQFKMDTGAYPSPSHSADFSELISNVLPSGLTSWNIDTGRGWRGPYLTLDDGLVTVCEMADANSSPIHCANSALISNIKGLADPFMREKILNNNATPTDNSDDNYSVLAWRACADATCDEREKYGSPYLLFDLDGAHPRIVSMGADGKYGGVNKTIPDTTAPDVCLPSTKNLDGTKNDTGLDDLVLCLK